MAGQCKKQSGLGIFGGSGEGMYYRVFEPVAYSARLKPPPPHGKPRLYCIKAGFKAGHGGSGSGHAATRTIYYMGGIGYARAKTGICL